MLARLKAFNAEQSKKLEDPEYKMAHLAKLANRELRDYGYGEEISERFIESLEKEKPTRKKELKTQTAKAKKLMKEIEKLMKEVESFKIKKYKPTKEVKTMMKTLKRVPSKKL